MYQPSKSRYLLAAVFGTGLACSSLSADVFYGNEIRGDLLRGDTELDNFSEVATWRNPEYQWDFAGDGFADVDIRQASIRFDFSLADGVELNLSDPDGEFFGWVFTDVNDTLADFESVTMTNDHCPSGVDWSQVDAQVLNANQFYVDFGSMAADDFIVDGDRARVVMTFVPAPAGLMGFVGLGIGTRRRRH